MVEKVSNMPKITKEMGRLERVDDLELMEIASIELRNADLGDVLVEVLDHPSFPNCKIIQLGKMRVRLNNLSALDDPRGLINFWNLVVEGRSARDQALSDPEKFPLHEAEITIRNKALEIFLESDKKTG